MKKRVFVYVLAAVGAAACGQKAELTMPSLFSNNMVVLWKSQVPFWGQATPGAAVSVSPSWTNEKYTTTTNSDGSWKVLVTTPESAAGPFNIVVACGADSIVLRNVLSGEVWLCSGQSNMEMPVAGWGQVLNYEQELAAANYNMVRLLKAEKACSTQPQSNCAVRDSGWQVCSPQSVADFSAIGYFFGRDIHESLSGIPVGIIDASWGGTIVEAWTSASSLRQVEGYAEAIDTIDAGAADNPNRPTVLFNAMIAPFVGYPVRGVLWYQGEANADKPVEYRTLFPLLIRDWRKLWDSEFAFYYVQLAGWQANSNGNWSLLREAQAMALQEPNTGMAVAFDIGNDADIHPKNKQEVARRLALIAKTKTYGMNVPSYSGPVMNHFHVEGNKVRIHYDYADGGLSTNNGKPLGGFVVAGSDGNYVPAQARIEGSDVVVWSAAVHSPANVRYGWTDVQGDANLCNGAGLPALPMRTDSDAK